MGQTLRGNWATLSIVGLLAVGSQSVLVGCGGTTLPAGPIVEAYPWSWDYTTDPQAYAVYVGESFHFSTQILDEATNPLTITGSCQLNDPTGAFQLVTPCPAGLTGPDGGTSQEETVTQPPDSAVVQVLFTPTKAQIYKATLTLATNATNDGGLVTIAINALGVDPDAGIPADAGVLEDAGLYDDGGGGGSGGSSGGCSSGGPGASGALLAAIAIGIAAFVRRRR